MFKFDQLVQNLIKKKKDLNQEKYKDTEIKVVSDTESYYYGHVKKGTATKHGYGCFI